MPATVFLSYNDYEFDDEGKAVTQALAPLRIEVVDVDFQAGLVETYGVAREAAIRAADVVVGIYGYDAGGQIPWTASGMRGRPSYREWDFRTAEQHRKPVLAFVRQLRERDELLEELLYRVHTRSANEPVSFRTTEELVSAVTQAVIDQLQAQRVNGRYRIVGGLGSGGQGTVCKAVDETTGETVALKRCNTAHPTAQKRFEREGALLKRLDHPALPKFIETFREYGVPYIVMENVDGQDLGTRRALQGRLPTDEVLDLAERLLEALVYLHDAPLFHLDIKPANIKIAHDGVVKLLDFGSADAELPGMTILSSCEVKTPPFAAPEQFARKLPDESRVEDRTDLYSLAVTLYHLLGPEDLQPAPERALELHVEGRDPYRPLHEFNSSVHPRISAVIQRAMSIRRDDRPSTAREMLSELRRARRLASPPPALAGTGVPEEELTSESYRAYLVTGDAVSWWADLFRQHSYGEIVLDTQSTGQTVRYARRIGVTTVEQLDRLLEDAKAWAPDLIAEFFAEREARNGRRSYVISRDYCVQVVLYATFAEEIAGTAGLDEWMRVEGSAAILRQAAARHNPRYGPG